MKHIFIYIVLICFSVSVYAGELSNFEIIGFNDTMTHFSFAEYGVNNNAEPYASLFIVNIQQNNFVNNGVFSQSYGVSPSIGENGKSALYDQLLSASSTLKQYKINPLNMGRLIYLLLDGEVVEQPILFTDYKSNVDYSIVLIQNIQGSGINSKGAFHIELEINNKSNKTIRKVGNPSYFRKGIISYKIRSIYTSLDDSSLIFVVEKLSHDKNGEVNVHYMVETITWQ